MFWQFLLRINYIALTWKVLFNFSNNSLAEHGRSLISRGLNFAILAKNVNDTDYVLSFQLFCRDIDLCEIPSYDKDRIKTRDMITLWLFWIKIITFLKWKWFLVIEVSETIHWSKQSFESYCTYGKQNYWYP